MGKKLNYFAMLLLSASMVACGGDDEPTLTPPTGDNDIEEIVGEDTSKPKEYFENTAKLFLDYFNADNHKGIITLLNDFAKTYEDYDIADQSNEKISSKGINVIIKNTANAISKGNYTRATGSDELFDYAQFTGIYEPNPDTECWERTGDSESLILKFDHYGAKCEFTITLSGNQWSANIDEETTVNVPKTITMTLTEGSTTHLKSTIQTDYNPNKHTLSANIDVKVADLQAFAQISGNDNEIKTTQKLIVNGKTLETAEATITGKNLCNREAIEDAINKEDATALKDYFTNATAETDILGRLQVKASVSSLYNIVKAIEDYEDAWEDAYVSSNYNYSDKVFEKIEKDYANTLNENTSCSFYFARNNTKQGDIIFKAIEDDDYYYTEYYTEMVLKFNDGGTYRFEEYFNENKFGSTVNQFENLIESYKQILNIN